MLRDKDIKRSYSEFSVNPLSLCAPEVYARELQIDHDLVNSIFSHFMFDAATSEIVKVERDQIPRVSSNIPPILVISHIVHCFPPFGPSCFGDVGTIRVPQLLSDTNIPSGEKERLPHQVHSILWQCMPDLSLASSIPSFGGFADEFH
jgi:hypothetical protein